PQPQLHLGADGAGNAGGHRRRPGQARSSPAAALRGERLVAPARADPPPAHASSCGEPHHPRAAQAAAGDGAGARRRRDARRRAVRRSRAATLVFLVLSVAAITGPFVASRCATIGARKVEADSAFRLALQELDTDQAAEGLAYLARVVETDSSNSAARILLYE